MIFIFFRTYQLYVGNNKIKNAIVKHYQDQGFDVTKISGLNLTERIKYGVPLIPVFRMYNYYFGIFSGKIDYVQKATIIDRNGNESLKYVELKIRRKKVMAFNEFDSYDL